MHALDMHTVVSVSRAASGFRGSCHATVDFAFILSMRVMTYMYALQWQVPLDGKLVHGTAQVSWSHISGEALPARLSPGQEVTAGSLNLDGRLVVQATHTFQDSTPARIARLTQQAQVGHYLTHMLCSVYVTPLWDLLVVCNLHTPMCA